jgi:hypothetical protein
MQDKEYAFRYWKRKRAAPSTLRFTLAVSHLISITVTYNHPPPKSEIGASIGFIRRRRRRPGFPAENLAPTTEPARRWGATGVGQARGCGGSIPAAAAAAAVRWGRSAAGSGGGVAAAARPARQWRGSGCRRRLAHGYSWLIAKTMCQGLNEAEVLTALLQSILYRSVSVTHFSPSSAAI